MPAFMIMRLALKLFLCHLHLIVSVIPQLSYFFSLFCSGNRYFPFVSRMFSPKHLFVIYQNYALFLFSDVPSRTVLTAAMMRITMLRYYTVTKMFDSESWWQLSCRVLLEASSRFMTLIVCICVLNPFLSDFLC